MGMYRKNLRTEKGRSAPYDKDPETEKAGDQIPDSSVIKMFVNRKQPVHRHHDQKSELAK